ncbi:CIC11C00000003899 [Sungouiella intermedia]|uniref:CIC11C00000003899 n=1 Tax=Sungouiella intermedia TaxID=45354 RepID=A0A1L0BBG4_9ASCO|nr:CIC11C00000003899 [[Candida] intermedia]
MISQTQLNPPQPSTTRATSTPISYDATNNRIAYASGKSIIVRSLDPHAKLEPTQFTKHTVTTTVATFSPSGNYIASGDESGLVKIWDSSVYGKENTFEQPIIKSEFQILSGPIKSIAWDADNTRVIAVGQGKDQFGHCFTWDSGNSIGEIQGHSETINAVDIKPQRPYRAATVGDDKALVFYTGPPFKFDKSLRGNHTNSVRAVKFSPDGKYLVSVGSDRVIVAYDGKTGELIKKIENAHDGGIFGVSWLADSTGFVTCSADNTLKLWNAESLDLTFTYTIFSPSTVDTQQVGVVVTKDYVVSLSLNGNLNFFKYDSSSPDKIVYGHQRALTALGVHQKTLITGGSDGSLQQWNIEGNRLDPVTLLFGKAHEKHSNYVTSIVSNGENVITAGWDDTLKLWNGETLEKTVNLTGQPKLIAVNDEDQIIVLFENKIEVFDGSLASIGSLELQFPASAVALIPGTSKILVNNTTSNRVEEYDVSGSISHSRSYPTLRGPPTLIKVSPDGQYAAVAENTGKYTLYSTKDASAVTTRWAFHSSKANDAAWTSDSKYIVSGGLDCGLFVYSVGRPAKVLKQQLAHQTGVTGVEWIDYSGDKGTFVSTGLDGVVKTWNVDFSVYSA